jgi:hypothetical protein
MLLFPTRIPGCSSVPCCSAACTQPSKTPSPVLRSPTVTRSGSFSTLRARPSTASGRVALNRARTQSGWVHAAITVSICGQGTAGGVASQCC